LVLVLENRPDWYDLRQYQQPHTNISVIKSRSFQKNPSISIAIQKKSIEKEPHLIAKTCADVSIVIGAHHIFFHLLFAGHYKTATVGVSFF
jgi:hypothetical protein